MKTKILIPHGPDCYALKNFNDGKWITPWAYVGDRISLDSIGRKGGNRRWLKIRCNCTQCPAIIIVYEDDILKQLPADQIEKKARK